MDTEHNNHSETLSAAGSAQLETPVESVDQNTTPIEGAKETASHPTPVEQPKQENDKQSDEKSEDMLSQVINSSPVKTAIKGKALFDSGKEIIDLVSGIRTKAMISIICAVLTVALIVFTPIFNHYWESSHMGTLIQVKETVENTGETAKGVLNDDVQTGKDVSQKIAPKNEKEDVPNDDAAKEKSGDSLFGGLMGTAQGLKESAKEKASDLKESAGELKESAGELKESAKEKLGQLPSFGGFNLKNDLTEITNRFGDRQDGPLSEDDQNYIDNKVESYTSSLSEGELKQVIGVFQVAQNALNKVVEMPSSAFNCNDGDAACNVTDVAKQRVDELFAGAKSQLPEYLDAAGQTKDELLKTFNEQRVVFVQTLGTVKAMLTPEALEGVSQSVFGFVTDAKNYATDFEANKEELKQIGEFIVMVALIAGGIYILYVCSLGGGLGGSFATYAFRLLGLGG